jgi:hypothetical protein
MTTTCHPRERSERGSAFFRRRYEVNRLERGSPRISRMKKIRENPPNRRNPRFKRFNAYEEREEKQIPRAPRGG